MSDNTDHIPSLAHLGPQWFTPVLGWSGLALAWHRGAEHFGPTALLVSRTCVGIAAAIFMLVTLASLIRARRYPAAFRADFSHPIRHGFAAAFPISILLLSTNALLHGGARNWIEPLWLLGVVLLFGVTAWVISRWMGGRVAWPSITPVLYIPVVGTIIVPLAAAPLGYQATGWFFFAIGAFFWPILTALVLIRSAHQPMPAPLLPSWFITIAPPAVGGLSAVGLGMPDTVLPAALGLAALAAVSCAIRVPQMFNTPFGMPAWATSFPMAAFSALSLRTASSVGAISMLSIALLAITTVLIIGLSLATLKGLRNGLLLLPEPAPIPVKAA